jgi:hypothetical protein
MPSQMGQSLDRTSSSIQPRLIKSTAKQRRATAVNHSMRHDDMKKRVIFSLWFLHVLLQVEKVVVERK